MRLNDKLITSFEYNGKKYDIDLSFDNVLDVFDYVENKDLHEYQRAILCLELLIGENSLELEESLELWNYVYKEFIELEDKKPIKVDLLGNPLPVEEENEKKTMDIEKDAEYIFASFKQAYNMNLFEQHGKLHWHEFKA